MIYCYDDLTGKKESTMTRDDIKRVQQHVLVTLGFDFTFNSPRHFLDRYFHVLSDYCTEEVKSLALQILILQQVSERLLDFSGSQLAASALILAINQNSMSQYIFNIEQGKNFEAQHKFFFG